MALVQIPRGLMWPYDWHMIGGTAPIAANTTLLLDATNEKIALIGHCYFEGRAASKVLSTGSIKFPGHISGIVWANGSTTMDVGIQDVASGSGPPVQPDGTYDVKGTAVPGGAGTINASTWCSVTMTTGSKTISQGQLIAVVIHLTNRAGADTFTGAFPSMFTARPAVCHQTGGTWALQTASASCAIHFDDGTIGYLDGGFTQILVNSLVNFADASGTDEFGMKFQVPFDCEFDAYWLRHLGSNAGVDYTVDGWSTPGGTPASLGPVTNLGEQISSGSGGPSFFPLAAPVALTRNTDYVVSAKHNGSSNLSLTSTDLADTAYRTFFPAGTTLARASRNDGSGAFSYESPALSMLHMGIRISAVHASGINSRPGASLIGGSLIA